jgi:prepilin-type N-terminal cleavage/methylation domain-containing protein
MITVKKNSGFTLVEVLVYLAIFLVVSTGAITLIVSLDDFILQYKVETSLYRSSTNVLEQVVTAARQAESFDASNSVLDSSTTGSLVVLKGGVGTVVKRTPTGDITLTVGGVDKGSLLSGNVVSDGFTVYKYDTAVGTFLRVKLDLTATESGITKTTSMYTGAVIRGDI